MKATLENFSVNYPLSYEQIKEEGWYEEHSGSYLLLFLRKSHNNCIAPVLAYKLKEREIVPVREDHAWNRGYNFSKREVQITI